MKSIKPGRGPSAMGAIGSVAVGVFGIFWTVGAASMGAPSFFVFFGIIFVVLAVIQGIYHYKNATGANRMSLFDVTEAEEEPDPLAKHFNKSRRVDNQIPEVDLGNTNHVNFCAYCGNRIIDSSFTYCPNCGKEMKK